MQTIKTNTTAAPANNQKNENAVADAIRDAEQAFIDLRRAATNDQSVSIVVLRAILECYTVGAFDPWTGNDATGKEWRSYVSDNLDSVDRQTAVENEKLSELDRGLQRTNPDVARNVHVRQVGQQAMLIACWLGNQRVTIERYANSNRSIIIPASAFDGMSKEVRNKLIPDGLKEYSFTFRRAYEAAGVFWGRIKDRTRADKDETVLNNARKVCDALFKMPDAKGNGEDKKAKAAKPYMPPKVVKAFNALLAAAIGAKTRMDEYNKVAKTTTPAQPAVNKLPA